MRAKPIVLAVITMAIGLVVAMALGEVVVRLSGVGSPLTYLPNPWYGWSHTPNDSFTRTTEDHVVEVNINDLGLRDYPYPYGKVRGRHRTLVLGDSFAEAVQVRLDASFAKGVERELNERTHDPETTYEVLNAGISGFGTDNALLYFRNEGYKYDPDIVLLAFYIGNDVRNNWYPLENIDSGGFRKPYFTPADGGLRLNAYPFEQHASLGSRVKVFLNRHVRLYSLIRELRDRFRNRAVAADIATKSEPIPLDSFLFSVDYSEDWETAWRVTGYLLKELKEATAQHGARLIVVIVPTQFQVHPEYWQNRVSRIPAMASIDWDLAKPNRLLAGYLDRDGIEYVDLLPEFRAKAEATGIEFYLVSDSHWNEAGHELAASLITDRLLEIIRR